MERVGFHRGNAHATEDRANSACCIVGAIAFAAETDDEYRQARAVMGEHLLISRGWRGATSYWSDRHCQGEAEAVTAMRDAAKLAEPEGFEPAHIVFPSQRVHA